MHSIATKTVSHFSSFRLMISIFKVLPSSSLMSELILSKSEALSLNRFSNTYLYRVIVFLNLYLAPESISYLICGISLNSIPYLSFGTSAKTLSSTLFTSTCWDLMVSACIPIFSLPFLELYAYLIILLLSLNVVPLLIFVTVSMNIALLANF